jgi:predicted acyltransferase
MSGNYTKILDNFNSTKTPQTGVGNQVNQMNLPVKSEDNLQQISHSRLESLDMFRGIAIFVMILINTCSYFPTNYFALIESQWDGFSLADCISPAFLFIMGYALNISHSKIHSKPKIVLKGITRLIIFTLIGVCLNYIQTRNFSFLRIPSVLFRLGLCSFFVSIFSICDIYLHLLFIVFFIASYTYLVYLLKVPFCEVGTLSQECFTGAYLDSLVFSKNHMILPVDPEGLVSTLTAQYTVFSGYFLAYNYNSIIVNHSVLADLLKYKIFYKWTLKLIANIILATISIRVSNTGSPINKKMYSISFTFSVTAICILIFTIFFSLIDLKKNKYREFLKNYFFSPLSYLGKNSLVIYIGHILVLVGIGEIKFEDNTNFWTWAFNTLNKYITEGKLVSLTLSFLHTVIWMILAIILFKCKLFIKI